MIYVKIFWVFPDAPNNLTNFTKEHIKSKITLTFSKSRNDMINTWPVLGRDTVCTA